MSQPPAFISMPSSSSSSRLHNCLNTFIPPEAIFPATKARFFLPLQAQTNEREHTDSSSCVCRLICQNSIDFSETFIETPLSLLPAVSGFINFSGRTLKARSDDY